MNTLPDSSPFSSSFTGSGPSVGVVMSHGFTGSPHSLRPWARYLAGEGFAVRLPLLPGHGTSWQDMATRHWQEWHNAVDAAYLELQAECDYATMCSPQGSPWEARLHSGSGPPGRLPAPS